MDDLLTRIRACTLCQASLPLGPRPVVQLDERARILIVGQAPGRKVHQTGLPFNDPSGDRLRRWLGVDRATFYTPAKFAIAPMGFCYPGTGPNGDLPPRPECAPAWRQEILDNLPNLELILAIGQYAQAWHLGAKRKKNLTTTVAAWQQYWPQILPLPHPSPRNMRWFQQNPWLETEVIPILQHRVSALLATT